MAATRLGLVAVLTVIKRSAKQFEPPSIPLVLRGRVARRLQSRGRLGEIEKTQLFHWTDKQRCKTTVPR